MIAISQGQPTSFTAVNVFAASPTLTPDGKYLYLLEGNPESNSTWNKRFEIFDITTLNSIGTFAYGKEGTPADIFGVGFTPDSQSAFVLNRHGVAIYSVPGSQQTGAIRDDGTQFDIGFLP